MRAVVIEKFGQPVSVQTVPDPVPAETGVVIKVKATGLCRSDWHAWMGHDTDVVLPHVPGHELAGEVAAAGKNVHNWKPGDRVTLPFVCACGVCPQCQSGNQQVCDHQFQPGFTHWGSFAEYVAIDRADGNLVRLPESMDYVTAASLGCRFVTSFRAVVEQGKVAAGQWVAVHGCGGVGLSAIMIASAAGANVVAIDIADDKLDLAKSIGAAAVINSKNTPDVVNAVMDITKGGAHVSIDALGNPTTCFNSIANLRKRGKHIQVGLMLGGQNHPAIPMDKVIARELEILGSHGIQAHKYPQLFELIESGKVDPSKLIGKTITLEEGAVALTEMDSFQGTGVKVIDRF
ncbi:zinc-dependent alcohol dehydrogenase family protein [Leptolinea tardivitalis]|uniref:Alcohol dehydrogenase n=1 Tax=Leptolinea tardivitalis TaxID=229920 RepID=A0A0P6XN63_9CHLR|nr:zinc-dependent alcohol dehydrogenase family protein [Leptolinea tardivitalis]KPL73437.1 alcohol dehydrogenase [Leptolinea tardivitalis]GAP21597.1 Zn-dependent alcohol dehydrogenases [Leptolinea tardivitalis]